VIDERTMRAILDGLHEEVTFVDAEHVIRYMNRLSVESFAEDGGAALVGTSIFDCHDDHACEIIRQVWAQFQEGEDEALISENEKRRIYMRAVRDSDGTLLGYYERYERFPGAKMTNS